MVENRPSASGIITEAVMRVPADVYAAGWTGERHQPILHDNPSFSFLREGIAPVAAIEPLVMLVFLRCPPFHFRSSSRYAKANPAGIG